MAAPPWPAMTTAATSFRIDAEAGGVVPRRYRPGARGRAQLAVGQWRVVLVTEGHGPAQRLTELLRGEGTSACTRPAAATSSACPPRRDSPAWRTGLLEAGFTWPSARLAVLTETDMAGQRTGGRQGRRMPSRRRGGIDPLQLQPGRLHRARAARRRPVRGDDQPDGAGRDPRLPGHRVRAEQARPPAGPAVPAHRPAGRGDQVLRRRGARRCTGWAARTGPRPRAGRARRCATSPPG